MNHLHDCNNSLRLTSLTSIASFPSCWRWWWSLAGCHAFDWLLSLLDKDEAIVFIVSLKDFLCGHYGLRSQLVILVCLLPGSILILPHSCCLIELFLCLLVLGNHFSEMGDLICLLVNCT